jgi:uncharacterized membrane protein YhhN
MNMVPWFILGLVSFLIGHILFIVAFYKIGARSIVYWAIPPMLVWGGAVVSQCLQNVPSGDPLQIGIPVYCLTILIMVHQALALYWTDRVGEVFAGRALFGAIMFAISDSVLAIYAFVLNSKEMSLFSQRQSLIMSTYFTALFFIAFSAFGAPKSFEVTKEKLN